MTHRHRTELFFRTDWRKKPAHDGGLDPGVQMMYMGAASDSQFMSSGEPKTCKEGWAGLLDAAQPSQAPLPTWPDKIKTLGKNAARYGWTVGLKELVRWFWDE